MIYPRLLDDDEIYNIATGCQHPPGVVVRPQSDNIKVEGEVGVTVSQICPLLQNNPCGGTMVAKKDWSVLTSPRDYNPAETCKWEVTPDSSCDEGQVEIKMIYYDIKDPHYFLKIRNADGILQRLIDEEGNLTSSIKSESFEVSLGGDKSGRRQAFQLQYRCGTTLFCDTNPCINGGNCSLTEQNCTCPAGFDGLFCQNGK